MFEDVEGECSEEKRGTTLYSQMNVLKRLRRNGNSFCSFPREKKPTSQPSVNAKRSMKNEWDNWRTWNEDWNMKNTLMHHFNFLMNKYVNEHISLLL